MSNLGTHLRWLLMKAGFVYSDRSISIRIPWCGWLSLNWIPDGRCKTCGVRFQFSGTQCSACHKMSAEYREWLKEYGAFLQ